MVEQCVRCGNARWDNCLALVCDEESLRNRMRQGRGIADEGWIESSVQYNNYFKEHDAIGDMSFDICSTEGKEIREVAKEVKNWVLDKLTRSN